MEFKNVKNPITGKFEKVKIPSEKEIRLEKMTTDELVASEENFADTGINGEGLWNLLTDKIYSWNPHWENKDTRIFISEMFNCQTDEVKNKMLQNPKIVEILEKAQKTTIILEKFKT